MSALIYGPCPHCCGEGVIYTSRYGGNDPDVWSTPCFECDDGSVLVYCDTCPGMPAAEFHDNQWWCVSCAKDWHAEQEQEQAA